uniref:Uncharacterized protein n=1 Tax=Strongyloides stercoralis TaxID=6248 RepID=A0AAF5DKI1_STRER
KATASNFSQKSSLGSDLAPIEQQSPFFSRRVSMLLIQFQLNNSFQNNITISLFVAWQKKSKTYLGFFLSKLALLLNESFTKELPCFRFSCSKDTSPTLLQKSLNALDSNPKKAPIPCFRLGSSRATASNSPYNSFHASNSFAPEESPTFSFSFSPHQKSSLAPDSDPLKQQPPILTEELPCSRFISSRTTASNSPQKSFYPLDSVPLTQFRLTSSRATSSNSFQKSIYTPDYASVERQPPICSRRFFTRQFQP